MARDGFLSRWSRKKLSEQPPDRPETSPDKEPALEPGALTEPDTPALDTPPLDVPEEPSLSDEELAALPKIEEITARTDLTQFMKRGVPKALKLAAMRKMWTVNPVISTYLDEARDYAYDWNTPGGVPGSGGTIDLADAARRVERMLSGARASSEPADAEPGPAETGDTESVETEAPPEAKKPARMVSPASEHPPASDKTLVLGALDEPTGVASEGNSDIPRRRHGGAIPRLG